MTDWSAVGKKSKGKGGNYERLVAKALTEFTGVGFRKTPNSGGFNKLGGVQVAGHIFCGDLICDRADFMFSVEAKNRKNFSFSAILANPETAPFTEWWFQTVRDAREVLLEPMLWFKPTPGSPVNLVALRDGFCNHEFCNLPVGMAMMMYKDRTLNFEITEKGPGEKKKRKHKVTAELPMPIIYHWKYLKENFNPEMLFGVPVIRDTPPDPKLPRAPAVERLIYGEIISYD